ncbi:MULTISPECIES: YciI family protein [Caballeronia]|uniref:YciI family protein n=1 Tax=Caballeronia TaxID=1827195 RepID=UPI00158EB1D3|nr:MULTISPECIES: YciI family protein [Caballeronia]MCG7404779.1 YciI family protein [Caballeronia zhejiangensis]MCI1046756.1 dehydrogenase [Caballeronia zhejiangensis]MDR5787319.1 YciI family protein [Caballeronia sp. LP003]
MAYLLLVVEPVEQRGQRTEEEGREAYRQMGEFAEGLKARGVLRAVESLTSLRDAARVSATNGDARVIDGPFAEAKEMIGGFFLIDCETRAEAVAIAAECPAAKWCTVEVRKVGPCYT